MLRYLPFLLVLALTIYTFIDCLNTDEEQVRHLPKAAWVIIILLFTIVGPVAWLIAGRSRATATGGAAGDPRPGRKRFVPPDDNPEFLATLKKSADEHEDMLKDWESDLRRREEELRRKSEEPDDGQKRD